MRVRNKVEALLLVSTIWPDGRIVPAKRNEWRMDECCSGQRVGGLNPFASLQTLALTAWLTSPPPPSCCIFPKGTNTWSQIDNIGRSAVWDTMEVVKWNWWRLAFVGRFLASKVLRMLNVAPIERRITYTYSTTRRAAVVMFILLIGDSCENFPYLPVVIVWYLWVCGNG